MNRLKMLALLPLILFVLPTAYVPRAHAALIGTVCIAAPGATPCPATPVHFPAQTAGSTLAVAVSIAGSDSLGGAQISVVTDPTILSPASISATGSVIPAGFTLVDCVNGVPQGTASCESGIDGVGVASYGQAGLGTLTVPPTTGLLFTITYNVLSASYSTISFLVVPPSGTFTGCSGQSVVGTNTCILVTAGAAVVPELQQGGSYGNQITLPTITAPSTATTAVGTTLTVPVTGSDTNAAETVTLSASGLTAGATFTQTSGNPASGQLAWTPTVGQQSFTVTFTATDSESPAQTKSTTTVVSSAIAAPIFVSVHEAAHHLNLAKVACMCQTFTATVSSNNLGTVYARVSITGTSGTASFIATSAITTISGVTSSVIVFSTGNLTPFIGVKFHWTATIMYSAAADLSGAATSPSTHSSAFAVV